MRIFIDIETCATSRPDVRDRLWGDVRPPANYKKTDAIMKWEAENAAAERDEAVSRTALNGLWGEIIVIGFAINDRDPIILYRIGTELDLLKAWCETLQDEAEIASVGPSANWAQRACWIGHNLEAFDLRFIWQRSCVLDYVIPFTMPLERYPKGPTRFDTMTEWAGYNGRVKQADLELAFGITRTDPLVRGGADVGKAYAEGRLEDVVTHCTEDVRCLREIYRRMGDV